MELRINSERASCRALLAAAQEGTELIVGTGPAVNREGKAPFIAARRRGPASLFVAVHEPLPAGRASTPRLRSVEVLSPEDPASPMIVVKVTLEGGRTDYFLSTLDDEPPFPSRRAAYPDCALWGKFAHVIETDGKVARASLVGTGLVFRGVTFRGAAYSGGITGVEREELGAKHNAFLTTGALPIGGALRGESLVLTYPDGRTHAYTIRGIEAAGEGRAILVEEEPGVEISPDAARFVYFPGNSFRGPTSFRIVPVTTAGK